MEDTQVDAPLSRVLKIQTSGGHAFEQGLPRWKRYADASPFSQLELEIIDPAPGKALMRAREARALGLDAKVREMPLQKAIRMDGPGALDVVLIAIDDSQSISECVFECGENDRACALNVFLLLPSGQLIGIRGAFGPEDRAMKIAVAAFFATLGVVTERPESSSEAVFGPGTPVANALLQGPMRDWFVVAVDRANQLAAGLRPTGAPFELTFDGLTTLPVAIRDSREGWADRDALVREIVDRKPFIIRKGTSFVVAEVGAEALQLVTGRLRITDNDIDIDTVEPVSKEAYIESRRRAEQAERDAADAIARSEQTRLTRLNPAVLTD